MIKETIYFIKHKAIGSSLVLISPFVEGSFFISSCENLWTKRYFRVRRLLLKSGKKDFQDLQKNWKHLFFTIFLYFLVSLVTNFQLSFDKNHRLWKCIFVHNQAIFNYLSTKSEDLGNAFLYTIKLGLGRFKSHMTQNKLFLAFSLKIWHRQYREILKYQRLVFDKWLGCQYVMDFCSSKEMNSDNHQRTFSYYRERKEEIYNPRKRSKLRMTHQTHIRICYLYLGVSVYERDQPIDLLFSKVLMVVSIRNLQGVEFASSLKEYAALLTFTFSHGCNLKGIPPT